jgi:hypothetical protein
MRTRDVLRLSVPPRTFSLATVDLVCSMASARIPIHYLKGQTMTDEEHAPTDGEKWNAVLQRGGGIGFRSLKDGTIAVACTDSDGEPIASYLLSLTTAANLSEMLRQAFTTVVKIHAARETDEFRVLFGRSVEIATEQEALALVDEHRRRQAEKN